MIMDAMYEIRQIEEQAQDIRKQAMEKARDILNQAEQYGNDLVSGIT